MEFRKIERNTSKPMQRLICYVACERTGPVALVLVLESAEVKTKLRLAFYALRSGTRRVDSTSCRAVRQPGDDDEEEEHATLTVSSTSRTTCD